jgi:LacI family transcriptional regulator
MGGQRVTITDIARKSGASRTTVSLVLRDRPGIGADTRDRVLAAAQELGYIRKAAVSRRPESDIRAVAILFRARIRSPYDRSLAVNPFYSWVLTGMESAARARRMNLLYGTLAVDSDNQITDAPDHLLAQALDGIIVVGAFSEGTIDDLLGERTTPLVLVDGPQGPQAPLTYDAIASDNFGGGLAATEHLLAHGHRKVAMISRIRGVTPNFDEREDGYLTAMAAAGLAPVVGRISDDDAAEAVDQVFDLDPKVTALFCVNDRFALDAVKAAVARGCTVPDRLSIIGFDNTDHGIASEPGLTTMSVDKVGMGRHAILTLEYRMQWPDAAPSRLILSPRLLSRGTVAPPRSAMIATNATTANIG